jgi:hypothetical protein
MADSSVSIADYSLAFGQSHFLRQIAIPFGNTLAAMSAQNPPAEVDSDWDPDVQLSPRADAFVLAGMIGAIVFVANWGTQKALDELYNGKLGPALRSAISVALSGEPTSKKYALSLLINKSPERISILVAAVGGSIEEMKLSEKQVLSVASQGLQRAKQLALPGQVHLYIVEGGVCNEHPWIHPHISSAMEQLHGMSTAGPVRFIANFS